MSRNPKWVLKMAAQNLREKGRRIFEYTANVDLLRLG